MIDEPIKRYWVVEVPLEVAWKTSIQALVEKGVIISILDKDNHLMVLEETPERGPFQRVTAERGFFTVVWHGLPCCLQRNRKKRME